MTSVRATPSGRLVGALPGPLVGLAREVGDPLALLGRLIATVFRNPRGFWADTRDETFYDLKKFFVPGSLALLGYNTMVSVFSVAILTFLGAGQRLGTVYLNFIVRNIAPFVTGVTVAGVIGTAITSEIGARKIREEIDALRVLGQDPVRSLVLPKVIAVTGTYLFMNLWVIVLLVAQGAIFVEWLGDTSSEAFLDSFLVNLTVPEVLSNLAKVTLIGIFIGVVCASKGLNTTRGAEGLGRAVNQAVVITTISVLTLTVVFNIILEGLTPSLTVSR